MRNNQGSSLENANQVTVAKKMHSKKRKINTTIIDLPGLTRTIMLAAWGSQCTNPCRNIISANV